MLLWFVVPSVVLVWAVFRSPAADYRFVALGSVVPLLELPFGEPRVLHSLAGAAAAMVAVMVGARGRRLLQRRLLGIPIGMLMHLVLDGAWADTKGFWWPALGFDWSSSELPELGRGPFGIVLELVGVAAAVWAWRRFRLDDPQRRGELFGTGRLGRDLVP